MKRKFALCATALCLIMALAPTAMAAELDAAVQVCYPTSVSRSEDGTEIRKYYDLSRRRIPPESPGRTLNRTASAIP